VSLTAQAAKQAQPKEKAYKLSDEKGLFLLINPNGSKYWRLKYRFLKKEKLLALGVYPEVSLKAARESRDNARQQLRNNIDPGEHRKATKRQHQEQAENCFESIAREWIAKYRPTWTESHGDKTLRRLERDIFPWIGSAPIATITAPTLLAALRRIEDRGALETAHRALQNCGQVFRYAVATGYAERDPSGDLKGALPPPRKKHLAAMTDPKQVGALLRAIDSYEGTFVTKCALRLAPLVFVRPGELRQAEWDEIDFGKAEWSIPAERMKMSEPHIVPLATQALELLKELQPLTGRGRYLFPSARSAKRPMSNNAILAALRRMGYSKEEMTGHGFRAMARTILDEVLGYRVEWIEHQLAHAVKDANGRAYNRTTYLPQRKEMMQRWADYLEELKSNTEGSNIIMVNFNGN